MISLLFRSTRFDWEEQDKLEKERLRGRSLLQMLIIPPSATRALPAIDR